MDAAPRGEVRPGASPLSGADRLVKPVPTVPQAGLPVRREALVSSRELLMIPGPVELEPEVMAALGGKTGSHVGPRFIATFGRVLKGLRQLFLAPTAQPFVLAGSGTLAMELAVANLVEPGDDALVVNTGYFGDRMALLLERHGAAVHQVRAPVGAVPTIGEIARALDARHYKLVAVTHVDTSTGVLAPVEPVARMACERGSLSLVDAVCSAAGEELRQEDWGIDVAITASQKALGVPPGLAIASVGARALAAYRARRHPVRAFSCDWGQWLPILQAYERGDAAYFATPPVNLVNALERSLALILEEGVEPRIARHQRLALALRAGWRALQLELVPRTEELTSHTMSALYLPAGADASLLSRVRDEGVVVAGGLHPEIKPRYFRVGHMGAVSANDVLATLGAIGRALKGLGARVDVGAAVGAAEQELADSADSEAGQP